MPRASRGAHSGHIIGSEPLVCPIVTGGGVMISFWRQSYTIKITNVLTSCCKIVSKTQETLFLISLTSLFVHRGRLTFPLPAYVPHYAARPLRGMYHVDRGTSTCHNAGIMIILALTLSMMLAAPSCNSRRTQPGAEKPSVSQPLFYIYMYSSTPQPIFEPAAIWPWRCRMPISRYILLFASDPAPLPRYLLLVAFRR